MNDSIQQLQLRLDQRTANFYKVVDCSNSYTLVSKLNKEYLNNYCDGSFKTFLDSLKQKGVSKIQLTPRRSNGSTSKPDGDITTITLENSRSKDTVNLAPEVSKTKSNQRMPLPGYSAAKADFLDARVTDLTDKCNIISAKLDEATRQRDEFKEEKTQLKYQLDRTLDKLERAKKSKRKAQKKADEPQGLMGIIPADQTPMLLEKLPGILMGVKELLKPSEGNKDNNTTTSNLSKTHDQIFATLAKWPETYMQELGIIIEKYTSNDTEFIEVVRKMIGVRTLNKEENNKTAEHG